MESNDFFVVVLGMSPTGLYAVREIGETGIRVYAADSEKLTAGYSRYLVAPIVEVDERVLLDRLLGLAHKEQRQGIILPTSDKYIEFVVRNARALSPLYRFQKSYQDGSYETIVDKGHFACKCNELGIAHPNTLTLHGNELLGGLAELRFPFILKPTLIHLVRDQLAGQKAFILRNPEEYLHCVKKIADIDASWMIQEIIPGPESRITLFGGYFDRNGQLHQPFTCRKLRQYPPGFGSASLVRSETLLETLDISRSFLQSMGFQGIAGTEFKFDDRDQQLKIIEINPRPTLWFGCSHASGMRIALNAVRDMAGTGSTEDLAPQVGVEWCYKGKDLATRFFYRFKARDFVLPREDISAYGKRVSRVWAVFSLADPLPVIGEWLNYLRKLIRRYWPLGN